MPFASQSQQTLSNDSLEIVGLIQQAEDTAEANLNAAYKLLTRAKEQAGLQGRPLLLAQALYSESYFLFFQGKYDQIITAMDQIIPVYEQLHLQEDLIKALNRKSLSFLYLNQYKPALDGFFRAKGLAELTKDNKVLGALNSNIGLVYESLKDWESALMFAQISLKYKLAELDTIGILKSYANIANIYYYQNKYSDALQNFRLAIKLADNSNNEFQQASLYNDIGNIYSSLRNFDSALYFQKKALNFHEKHKDERFVEWCNSAISYGATLIKCGKVAASRPLIAACQSCELELGELDLLKNLYNFRSDYFYATGNMSAAAQAYRKLNAINDSILTNSEDINNQRLAIKYEFEKKAKEDSLQYQLRISQQQAKTIAYRNKMYLTAMGLLLSLGVTFLAYFYINRAQKEKRRKELEAIRTNIASDLHDDVGSTLSSIQIISGLATKQCGDNEQLKQTIGNITELSNKVAQGIREIMWTINPTQDTLEAVVAQLRKIGTDLLEMHQIALKTTEQISNPNTTLSATQRKELLLFFKEAINNARKYSYCSTIHVAISDAQGTFRLTIRDNGIGFNKKKVVLGNGIKNMHHRASNLKGAFEISSKVKSGTQILLTFPLP
ncbi:MAG: tetratricopeptide repeat protein [Bacteroidetes bacterium]|nr:tetratricopeptide repeat protein [Bacteroidota bacterium]